MNGTEILTKALDELKDMSSAEVKERSREVGIEIKEETGKSDSNVDLYGLFPEAINTN